MSADREWALADLVAFRPDGECVLFIRPRRALTDAEMDALMYSIAEFKIPGVTQWFVPHDYELLALGDAEMEKIGFVRLPTTKPDEPAASDPRYIAPICPYCGGDEREPPLPMTETG